MRIAAFVYGAVVYAVFFASFLYLAAFVNNVVVPKSIDSGTPSELLPALLVNLGLVLLFAVQHTIMARPRFKKWWTRFVPAPIERSTFVLATVCILALWFWLWRPLPDAIWTVTHPVAFWALVGVGALGWLIVLVSTFLLGHFQLFGLTQVWCHLRGAELPEQKFRKPFLYKHVRHPLMLGFLLALWGTPNMTVGHLVLAGALTGYILFGTRVEERDLVRALGPVYLDYRREVPGLLPFTKRSPARPAATAEAAD